MYDILGKPTYIYLRGHHASMLIRILHERFAESDIFYSPYAFWLHRLLYNIDTSCKAVSGSYIPKFVMSEFMKKPSTDHTVEQKFLDK